MSYTTEDIKNKIDVATNSEYQLVSEYKGAHTKVRIQHKTCGETQEVRLDHFMKGTRCKHCKPPRKSNDDFLKEVYELTGEEYTFLEEYKNCSTVVKIIHNICGHIYKVRPANFLSGKRCPLCAKNMPLTTETFKIRVFDLVESEYEVVSEYVNSQTKINLLHRICGNIIDIVPSSFIAGNRCRYCNGGVKTRDTKSFKSEVQALSNGEYTVIGNYENTNSKILFRHEICHHEYFVSPNDFLSGRRCPDCFGNKKLTTEEFKDRVFKMYENEYEVLGEYINNSTKIKMKHLKCEHVYETAPRDFLAHRRCPNCFKNIKRTNQSFKNELFEIFGDKYTVIGEYINANSPIEVIHNDCGKSFCPTPSNILRGISNCSNCSESIGAKMVNEYLSSKNYNYKKEYSFEDCKRIHRLRFDFAILNKYDELQCLIEYDGIQHFQPAFGEQSFITTQESDAIKDKYCKDNKINLIRIPYWDRDNIIEILDRELSIYKERGRTSLAV